MSNLEPVNNLGDETEVRAYFEQLERECPQVVEALRVMNIPYRQYLAALQAMKQPSSVSTSSAKLSF
jgi:wyosine [tRNA(Phe)-imidazoG37] synthetase (radical SAM superfamily)